MIRTIVTSLEYNSWIAKSKVSELHLMSQRFFKNSSAIDIRQKTCKTSKLLIF